jgi:two-component system, cell cycle sensor histidine kinase and response regulator CckA
VKDTDEIRNELERQVEHLSSKVLVLDAESQTVKIALQGFGDALISTDTSGNIVQMNTAAEAMTGWPRTDAIGQPLANVFKVVSELTGNEVESLVERLLRERIVADWTNHTLLIAKDGSERPIANGGASIRNAKGEITGAVLVFRDQTAERATLKALTESEARFREMFEWSTVGKALTAPDGQLIKVNQAFADMLGLSIGEMQQVNFLELTHPDDIAGSLECSRCLLADERSVCRLERRYKHRDGHFMIADVSMTLTRDQLGQPLHFVTNIVDITERSRLESALKASEVRYRRLFEAAKDGILILDSNTGEIVDVNPFLIELTGYSHHDFLGKHLWEIGPFKDIAASNAAFATLQTQKYVRNEDLPLMARDGRKLEVEFVSNVYPVDGRDVIQCNIRDVTTRKQSERRILENSARMTAILESADAAIFSIDHGFCYTGFNRAYARLIKEAFGVDIKVGARLAECQTVIEPCLVSRSSLERALQGETVVEYATSGGEGRSPRYLEVAHNPVRTDAGEIVGVSTFIRDVTAKKQAAEALRFNNLVLTTQQETSLDGILVVDASGKIVSFNQRFVDMWGIARPVMESRSDELALQSVLDKLEDPQEFITKVNTLYATDEKSRDDITLRDKRTFDRYSAPMLDADKNRFGRVWYFRDITDRKRAESEREKLEEELRASQKMEAIGRLAGGVAHDFNNLLAVILIYTGFAMDRVTGSVKDELVEVKKAADRGVALVQQLLTFSRKKVQQTAPLDLSKAVAAVGSMLQLVLGEDIELIQVLAPNLWLTLADPSQIEQLLMNLVVNARDATPGGGRLTIETSNVEIDEQYAATAAKPGSYVQLVITDTGLGIDEQTQARIFEPFFTTKSTGTGLGLSTVFGIVKQSGGNIWVYSEPGTGTTFKIHLPREFSTGTATCNRPPPMSRSGVGAETILLVEDDEVLRRAVKRTLDASGYTVLAAANGTDALLACARHTGDIHLLLTDVVMPQMSGKTLAEKLLSVRPTLRVLYMSGYTDSIVDQHGVLPVGAHFVGKPFATEDLIRMVREVLDLT